MTAPASFTASKSAGIIRGQREHLLPAILHMYKEPLVLTEGDGVRVLDAEGNEYLDLFAGILTTSVGHCNARVNAAVTQQMNRLGHVSTLYATDTQVEAARRIADIAPGSLKRTFFSNSGTEAIETALTMACLATGRSEIVALRLAYHGRSALATSITAQAGWRPLATPVAGIKHAKAPNPYRCPYKQPCDDSCVDRFVEDLKPQLALLKKYNYGKQIIAIEKVIQERPPQSYNSPTSAVPPTMPIEIESSAPTPMLTNGQNSPQSSSLPSTNVSTIEDPTDVAGKSDSKTCPDVEIHGL